MKKSWPVFVIAGFVALLSALNYTPGTFLTGGDNLHPELHSVVNIKRSIFAVWQEYQGVGLLGGMAHASDLVRQVVLALLSFILPLSVLRYLWTFSAIFLGTLGAYYLIRLIIKRGEVQNFQSQTSELRVQENFRTDLSAQLVPLLGAIFYLLNLATIQAFHIPFEVFTAHFAALPWLLLTGLYYWQNQNLKNLAIFILVLALSGTQAYVPTLFLVFVMAITIIVLPSKVSNMKRFVKLYAVIFLTNAFWLLPFLYFTFTNANVNINAKINQMATETIFLQNKEFGNALDVMLLRGFWFSNVDPNTQGNFAYQFAPWRQHVANPFIQSIGYLFFIIILIGIIKAMQSRKPLLTGFAVVFVFSFTMLATNTPPFSWIDELFRKIPLFEQAFRFPFTKFSILAALTYSIFFAIGMQTVFRNIKFIKIITVITIIVLVMYVFPAFRGYLFYEKERLTISQEYFALFDFFKKQDPGTRIANFPQPSFWGWNFYRWGYGGSGFLWYGIQQPILDRAFDVWSATSENYYWETSLALYGKNAAAFADVLNKYQITWLLVDNNAINPPTPKALFIKELEALIGEIPTITRQARFGNLSVYKVNLQDKPEDFIFLSTKLPTINSYTFGNHDQGYSDYGNYIAALSPRGEAGNPQLSTLNYFYPFRSLLSSKTQKEKEFTLEEEERAIVFKKSIPITTDMMLKIPSFVQKEKIVPVEIYTKKNDDRSLTISLIIKTPEIRLANKKLAGSLTEKPLFAVLPTVRYPLNITINGVINFPITYEDAYVGTTFLSVQQDNSIVLLDKNAQNLETQTVASSFIASLAILQESFVAISKEQSEVSLTVKIPKIKDTYTSFQGYAKSVPVTNCDNFRKGNVSSFWREDFLVFTSRNATACTSLDISTFLHEGGYAIFIKNRNIQGRGLHFWVLNEDQKYSPIDTYLPSSREQSLATFVLPPQDPFGKAYSFHFENVSIGSTETINALGKVSLYPIPYYFLTELVVVGPNSKIARTLQTSEKKPSSLQVMHPNESLYVVNGLQSTDYGKTLVLSQSYNSGWKMYHIKSYESGIMKYANLTFPFLFGKEVKEHVLVNNWENGWVLSNETMQQSNNTRVIIVFLPQYLQYIGFALLIATLILAIISLFKSRL